MDIQKACLRFGRRTGTDILKGKTIRRRRGGADIFQDYWTDSEGPGSQSDSWETSFSGCSGENILSRSEFEFSDGDKKEHMAKQKHTKQSLAIDDILSHDEAEARSITSENCKEIRNNVKHQLLQKKFNFTSNKISSLQEFRTPTKQSKLSCTESSETNEILNASNITKSENVTAINSTSAFAKAINKSRKSLMPPKLISKSLIDGNINSMDMLDKSTTVTPLFKTIDKMISLPLEKDLNIENLNMTKNAMDTQKMCLNYDKYDALMIQMINDNRNKQKPLGEMDKETVGSVNSCTNNQNYINAVMENDGHDYANKANQRRILLELNCEPCDRTPNQDEKSLSKQRSNKNSKIMPSHQSFGKHNSSILSKPISSLENINLCEQDISEDDVENVVLSKTAGKHIVSQNSKFSRNISSHVSLNKFNISVSKDQSKFISSVETLGHKISSVEDGLENIVTESKMAKRKIRRKRKSILPKFKRKKQTDPIPLLEECKQCDQNTPEDENELKSKTANKQVASVLPKFKVSTNAPLHGSHSRHYSSALKNQDKPILLVQTFEHEEYAVSNNLVKNVIKTKTAYKEIYKSKYFPSKLKGKKITSRKRKVQKNTGKISKSSHFTADNKYDFSVSKEQIFPDSIKSHLIFKSDKEVNPEDDLEYSFRSKRAKKHEETAKENNTVEHISDELKEVESNSMKRQCKSNRQRYPPLNHWRNEKRNELQFKNGQIDDVLRIDKGTNNAALKQIQSCAVIKEHSSVVKSKTEPNSVFETSPKNQEESSLGDEFMEDVSKSKKAKIVTKGKHTVEDAHKNTENIMSKHMNKKQSHVKKVNQDAENNRSVQLVHLTSKHESLEQELSVRPNTQLSSKKTLYKKRRKSIVCKFSKSRSSNIKKNTTEDKRIVRGIQNNSEYSFKLRSSNKKATDIEKKNQDSGNLDCQSANVTPPQRKSPEQEISLHNNLLSCKRDTVKLKKPQKGCDSDEVRRSSRQRYAPFDHWRNERLLYRFESGDIKILGIDKGTNADNSASIQLQRTCMSNEENYKSTKLEKAYVYENVQNKESCVDIMKTFSSVPWNEPACTPEHAAYHFKKVFESSNYSFGFMAIAGFRGKPTQYMPDEDLQMTVMKGNIEVIVQGNIYEVREKDMFVVPKGAAYSLKNLKSKEALLSFAVGKFNFLNT